MHATAHARQTHPTPVADRNGNVAVLFALILPVICLAAGAGFDFQRRFDQQTRLQEFADTLALRGAREFLLANASADQIRALLEAVVETGLAANNGVGLFTMAVAVDEKAREVTVSLEQPPAPALIAKAVPSLNGPLAVNATATASGGANVCVIALEDSAAGAVDAQLGSTLDAGSCALMSNSTSSSGVRASGRSKIAASMICSAGGYLGASSAFEPAPVTNCPVTEDPLIARDPPTVGPCDHVDFIVGERSFENLAAAGLASLGELSGDGPEMERTEYTIDPGVYCGGLSVASNAAVTFNPGVYVIKDGPFIVDLNGAIGGEGVAFHLEGDDATFLFSPDSKIDLSAPKEGLLAGILFYEDRDSRTGRTHSILSNDARTLLGTFYLPNSTLFVSTVSPVADRSAYTAIVARRLAMAGSPTLVLNADYALTDVPVPDGIGPVGGQVFLRE